MSYVIRPMQDKDIPQAIEIDREAFPTQLPHPTYASFRHELRNRLAHYMVASTQKETNPEASAHNTNNNGIWQRLLQLKHLFDHDRFFGEEKPPPSKEYVVGIAGFWVMVGEAHITTVAVRDANKKQGIGEWLLISIIDMATQLKSNIITLEVRASNKQAQSLYEKYNFRQAGLRRRYYTDNGEDALIMSTDTITSTSFQSHFQQLKQANQQRRKELYEISQVV